MKQYYQSKLLVFIAYIIIFILFLWVCFTAEAAEYKFADQWTWKDAYKQYGKGSPEEMAAYQIYVGVSQGRIKYKPAKKIKQPDLAGMSERENFSLVNQEVEISGPLARQERTETLTLF